MWLQRKPLDVNFARLAAFLLAAGKAGSPTAALPAADSIVRLGPDECAVGAVTALTSMGDWFINGLAESLVSGPQANLVDLAEWWGKPAPGLVERYRTLPERFGHEPLDTGSGIGQRFAQVVPPIHNLVEHFSNAWQLPSPPAEVQHGESYRPAFREVSIAFASEAAIAFVDASIAVADRVGCPGRMSDDFRKLRAIAEAPSPDDGARPVPSTFSRKARKIR